jgi:hypothetical protein
MNKTQRKKAGLWMLVGVLLFLPASLSAASVLRIVLKETNRIYWEKPVSSAFVFSLRHLNSIYDTSVEEAFRVDDQGLIWLQALRTDSAGVLEYYGLEEVSREWITLSRPIGRISLIITPRGEVTFRNGDEEIPLSKLLPDGARVEIRAVQGNR